MILAAWKEEGSLQTPSFISRGKRDLQSLNLRGRIRNQSEQQIMPECMFPIVHTMCLLFISPHVPAISTSAPSGAVSLFSIAPFPLAYCFFFPFPYLIRHPSLGLVIFLPYMCRVESIKGVITANFKDCQKFISVANMLRLQRTRA